MRAGSSVWQSDGLLIRRSRVQIAPSPFSAPNTVMSKAATDLNARSEQSERLSVQIASSPFSATKNPKEQHSLSQRSWQAER